MAGVSCLQKCTITMSIEEPEQKRRKWSPFLFRFYWERRPREEVVNFFASWREEIKWQKRRRIRNRWKGKTFLSSVDCARSSATARKRSLALLHRKSASLWHTRYQVIPVVGGVVAGWIDSWAWRLVSAGEWWYDPLAESAAGLGWSEWWWWKPFFETSAAFIAPVPVHKNLAELIKLNCEAGMVAELLKKVILVFIRNISPCSSTLYRCGVNRFLKSRYYRHTRDSLNEGCAISGRSEET